MKQAKMFLKHVTRALIIMAVVGWPGIAHAVLLTDGLVAYWHLDEAGGTRFDAVGSNDLTNHNTVTQAAGILGSAAQFTSVNNEYLSIADTANLSMAAHADFSMTAWVYLDSKPGGDNMFILGKMIDGSASNAEYGMYWATATDNLRAYLSDGVGITNLQATSFGAPPLSTWIWMAEWYDATADTWNVQINNGAVDSIANTTGSQNTVNDFAIGRLPGDNSAYWNGRIDEVGIWKRVLTDAERTTLYADPAAVFRAPSASPAIPEPSSLVLLGAGLLGLTGRRRQRV